MENDFRKKWQNCLDFIRDNIGEARYKTWFAVAEAISFANNCLTLKLPSHFCYEKYEDDFYNVLRSGLRKSFGTNIKLSYEVPMIKDDDEAKVTLASPEQSPLLKNKFEQTNFQQPAIRDDKITGGNSFDSQLNSAYTFENYCVGESNKLAFTIAEYISNHPKNSSFNPFFLYGDVGVGKTHLIQAIGIRVKEKNPNAKVLFTSMNQFQTLYAHAVLAKKIPNFIQWFMEMDVLLFDDLQQIAHKYKTSNDALFPIFNHLHQSGRQLIFTCDRPPMELDGIAERLIDRFKWGITEKLPKPDAKLRKDILVSKAHHNGLDLPEEVIDLIVEKCTSSVREIEGIVMGILTRSITLNRPITLELARDVMNNSVRVPEKKTLNFDMILETTAEHYSLNPDVLFTKSRVRDIADARQVIMYLCNKHTEMSSVNIGMRLNRKHTTVLHGIETVKERACVCEGLARRIEEIEKDLGVN